MGWRCRIWFKSPGALHKDRPPRISLKYARPLYTAYSNPKKIPQGRYFNRKEAEDQREGSNLLLHKSLISGVRILALLTALGPSTSYSALWASVSVSVNYRLIECLGKAHLDTSWKALRGMWGESLSIWTIRVYRGNGHCLGGKAALGLPDPWGLKW